MNNLKTIYFIIGRSFSKKLLILSVFLIFGMFFEIAGLGLLIPLLKIISDPEFLNDPTVLSILNTFSINKDHFFYILLGITLLSNLLKTLLLILLNYKQLKILNDLNNTGITIVLVTHEDDIANYGSRIIRMKDGKILEDKKNVPN